MWAGLTYVKRRCFSVVVVYFGRGPRGLRADAHFFFYGLWDQGHRGLGWTAYSIWMGVIFSVRHSAVSSCWLSSNQYLRKGEVGGGGTALHLWWRAMRWNYRGVPTHVFCVSHCYSAQHAMGWIELKMCLFADWHTIGFSIALIMCLVVCGWFMVCCLFVSFCPFGFQPLYFSANPSCKISSFRKEHSLFPKSMKGYSNRRVFLSDWQHRIHFYRSAVIQNFWIAFFIKNIQRWSNSAITTQWKRTENELKESRLTVFRWKKTERLSKYLQIASLIYWETHDFSLTCHLQINI